MSSSTVEKIKERLNIVDVISFYLKLDKAGSNFKAKCPFHNEKTPSFFVSPDRGSYYCFGCGVKGDIFSFVEEFERVDFVGALKILAERAGVPLEYESPQDGNKSGKEKLFASLEEATLFFVNTLNKNLEAKEYLTKRGLTDKTITEWRLGFAEESWHALENYLKAKGFSEGTLDKAGLIKRGDKGYYDRFRGRVMFPLFDASSRVVAFSGRILKIAEDEAKYINSPETELFVKSKILYGYDRAKHEIRKKDYTILVEGQMDLIMCHQEGFKNAVATSGTALTLSHLEILKRISANVMVVYDADSAGMNASLKAWKEALTIGMDVKIVSLPKGMDPAKLLSKDKEAGRQALKHSKHVIDFCLEGLITEGLEDRRLLLAVEEKVLPYVYSLESEIEQAHFVSKIASLLKVKDEVVWHELAKIRGNLPVRNAINDSQEFTSLENRTRLASLKRQLIGILLWQMTKESSDVDVALFKNQLIDSIGVDELAKVLSRDFTLRDELIFEAERYYEQNKKLSEDIHQLLLYLQEEILKIERDKLTVQLSEAEKKKGSSTSATINNPDR